MRKIGFAVVVAIVFLCAPSVFAQTDIPPFYQDPDPYGTAPGLVRCASVLGCKACVLPDVNPTGKFVCATVPEMNGSCKCEYKNGACATSGSCTYVLH